MSPIRSLKRLDSELQEGRIQLALKALNKGEISSIRAAAASHVPAATWHAGTTAYHNAVLHTPIHID